jgi:transposase
MKDITELRERALNALKNGHSRSAVRAIFGLGVNTLRKWELLERETGSLENRPHEHKPWKIDREKLLEYYRENPRSTNKEAALAFNYSISGIRSAKAALKITRKKTKCYSERDENERQRFVAEVASLPADSEIYYIDESGFDEYYHREYGYALRGQKVYGEVSGRRFARTSIVAAKCGDKIVAPFAFRGTMDADLFEGWLEQMLMPALENISSSVIILDNASVHNKLRLYELADEHGFRLIFLPPYSPDFNPIEKFWANVKNRMRLSMHNYSSFGNALAHAFT